jgi:hypothetical protein
MGQWSLVPVLVVVAGCAETPGVRTHQEEWAIAGADPDAVLAEAGAVLQREFGRVKIDRGARRIETAPVEYTTSRGSGAVRDVYGGRSTMRRVAYFTVGSRGGTTVAALQVNVERRDTVQRAVTPATGYRLSDSPGAETPVDRDAATTLEQNTVWTFVRRDRTLERQLLDEVRERFARGEAATQPATAPAGG